MKKNADSTGLIRGQLIAGGGARAAALALALTLFPALAQAFPSWMGNCCSHANRVTTGTLYAGDLVRFEILMNQDYYGLNAEVGINDGGWLTYAMSYGGGDSGNSWWYYEKRFASGTKNFYFHGWEGSNNIYDNNGGANYSVTITALNAPSGQSASRDTTNPHSQINLGWTRGTSGSVKDTVIFRSTSSTTPTPAGGTSYTAGNDYTLGGISYRCLYKGSGTNTSDSGLSAGTTYYYYFFAENYSYYSAAVSANATTRTIDSKWDGGGLDNYFKTEANWTNDVYPQASSSSVLHFDGSTRVFATNDWAANSDFGRLIFDSGASSFTLAGNAINLNSAITNFSSNLQTVNLNQTLTAAATYSAANGALTLGGTIANGGYGLTVDGNNAVTFGTTVSGTGDLTKQGSGTATLQGSADNAYLEAAVNGGVLVLNKSSSSSIHALGGSTTTIGGGTLQLSGSGGDQLENGVSVTVNSGAFDLNGKSETISALTLNGTGISSAGALYNGTGSATLTLGAVSYVGNSGASAGGAGDITIAGNYELKNSSTAVTLTKVGNGTLTLSNNGGDNLNLLIAVSGGTVVLNKTSSSSVHAAGTLTVNSGGTAKLSGTGGYQIYQGSTLTTVNSGGVLDMNGASQTFTSTGPTINGTGIASGGALVNNGGSASTLTSKLVLGSNSSIGGSGSLTISDVISGAYTLTKVGAGTLTLQGVNTYSGATTISGGILSVAADSGLGAAPGSATAGQLAFNAGQLSITTGFTLSANRGIAMTGAGTIDVASGQTLSYGGIIAGSGGNLTKTGSGTLTLSGNNTFSTALSLGGGTIIGTTSAGALGAGTLTLNTASTTLEMDNDTALNFGRNTTVSANVTVKSGRLGSGAGVKHTLGTLGIGANTLSVAVGPNVSSGTGTVAFGATTLSANGAVFDVGASAGLSLDAIGGNFTWTKQGSGSLTLTSAGTGGSASRDVTLSGGLTIMQHGDAFGSGAANDVNINSGAILELNGSGLAFNGSQLIYLNNGGTLRSAGNNSTSAKITLGAGADATIAAVGASDTFTIGNGANDITGGNGSTTLRTSGAGTILLAQSSDYAGNWSLDSGTTLLQSSDNAFGQTSTATLTLNGAALTVNRTASSAYTGGAGNNVIAAASTTITSDRTTSGAGYTYTFGSLSIGNRTLSIAKGANVASGTAGITFGGLALTGAPTFDAASGTLLTLGAITNSTYLVTVQGAGNTTISGAIGSGSGGLTKAGAGTLTLSGANTYGGATTISAGTLKLGAAGVIPDGGSAGNVTMNPSSGTATLDLNGNSETVNGLSSSGAGSSVVEGTSGTPTLTVGGNNQSSTFAGLIKNTGGSLTLAKTGSGTLVLSGANTYSGGTTLGAGQLDINYGGSSAANSAIGTATLTISGGALGNSSGGTVTLLPNNAQAWNGDFAFAGANALSMGTGAVTLGGNRQVTVSSSTLTVGGVIDDGVNSYSLTKAGSGNLTLSGVNTYGGNTVVSAGTLALSGSGSIANSPAISIAAGATFDVSGRSSALTLASAQALTITAAGSASPATIATTTSKGLATAGNNAITFSSFSSAGGAPLALTGAGTLTLSSGDSVTVTVSGGALADGDYVLISKGSSGGVAGTAPGSVTVNGSGIAGTASTLVIVGGELVLRCGSVPTLTTPTAVSIGTTTGTLGATVSSLGGAPSLTSRGTVWGTSAAPTGNGQAEGGTGAGDFSHIRTGFSPNVLYYYRGYAVNFAGTGYSADGTFRTAANVPGTPTVAAVSASSLSVDVETNSNPAGTEFAIHETTQNKFVQADGSLGASAAWDTDPNWGTKTVTGLNPNQQYTFEVKARNGASTETTYSSTASKYTLANTPAAPTVNNATQTTLDVAVNENSNPSTTEFAIRVNTTQYVQSDGSLGASAFWATKSAWGTKTVTGLASTTLYTFDVKARNGDSVETGFGSTAGGTTLSSAVSVWTGGGADNKWTTGNNWSDLAAPVSTTNATFYTGITSGTNINIDLSQTILGVRFNSAADSALNITNSQLTINGGGIAVDAGADGAHVLAMPIALGATQAWTNDSAATLSVKGVISGSGALTKYGSGKITLSGNNTFTGALTINNGVLQIQHANGLGDVAAGTSVSSGGALEMQGTISVGAEALSLSGAGVSSGGALRNTANANTFGGAITLAADAEIQVDSSTLTLGGGITGGANTLYAQVDGTALDMSAGTFSGSKTTGDGALRKTGTGRFLLRPDSGLTGSIYLDAGSIQQGTGNSSTLPAGGALYLADGVTYRSDGNTARTVAKNVQLNGNITLGHTGGSGAVTISGNVDLNSATRSLTVPNDNTISGILSNGGLTKLGSGTLTLSGANSYSSDTTISAGTLQIGAGSTSGSVAGNIVDNSALAHNRSDDVTFSYDVSGSGTFTKLGAGALTLSGNNSYAGLTTVSGGTLKLGHANALGTTAAGTTVSSGYTLDLNGQAIGAEALTITGSGISSAGALQNSSGTPASLSGGITLGGAATIGGAGDSTLSGAITGTAALTKQGAGAITLSADNSATLTGAGSTVTISAGTLKLGHAGALGDTSAGTTANGGTLDLNGLTVGAEPLTVAGTGAGSAGALVNNSGTASLSGNITMSSAATIGGSGDSTLSGTITGSTPLTKVGTGTITLSGNSAATMTGIITNNGGTLKLGNAGALGDTAAGTVVNSGYTLDLSGQTIGAEPLTLAGDGVGSSGALINSSGSSASLSGNITLSASATIGVSAGDLSLGGAINESSGTMNVTKIGSGTLTLSGANLLNGNWNISAGTLKVGGVNALGTTGGSGATTIISSGAVLDLNGIAVGNSKVTLNGTGISSGGAMINSSVSMASLGGALTLASPSSIGGSGDIILSNSIAGTSSDYLTKVGSGTLKLTTSSGSWAADHKVIVNAGTIAFSQAGNRFGTAPASVLSDFLTLNGGGIKLVDGATAPTWLVNRGITLGSSGGKIAADTGLTLTLDAVITGSGNLTIEGPGTVFLSTVNNTYTGKTILNSGTLLIGTETKLGDSTSGTADQVTLNGGTLQANADMTIDDANRGFTVSASSVFDTQGYNVDLGEAIAGSASLSKIGAGALRIYGAAGTYSGTLTINQGAVHVNSNLGSMPVIVTAGTTLRGAGTISSATVNGSIEPGSGDNVIGRLTANVTGTGLTLPGAGTYRWEVTNATGTAGTDYDQIKLGSSGNQTASITASSGSRFNIEVDSNSGTPGNWNANTNFAWTIIDGGTLSGFDTNVFSINTTSFTPSISGGFFALENVSGDLMLYYIGEPASSAASVNFSSVSDTGLTINWTRGGGNRCLVLVKDTSAVDGAPVDGATYTASATFASGTQIGTGNYVVYDGIGTSVAVTGLTASHTYYVAVYEYQFGGAAPSAGRTNFRLTSPATGNATTYAAEPSLNPDAPTFTQVAGTSMKIAWTNGSGPGTIVLVKESTSVNSDPSDGTTYTASTTFGSGTQIGTGNYVVYAGADSGYGSVTVTGLREGTTYYVALYSYNGAGSLLNYKAPTSSTGNKRTLGEPTAVVANANGKELVNLSWTRDNSHDTLILAKGSAISTPPTAGVGYSVGSTIDGATVIYTGSGSALDHVVRPNSTNFYRFFTRSATEDYYSTGTPVSVTMADYDSYEVVETFSYTNSTAFNTIGTSGGAKWNGNWSGDTSAFYVQGGSFSTQPNYPATAGNKLKVSPGGAEVKQVTRSVTNWLNHVVYASFILNYQYNGASKWAGAYLMDNSTPRVFFGESGGGDEKLAVHSATSTKSVYAGSGNDYVIIVKYDVDNDNAYASAYKIGTDTVPASEPSSWDAEYLNVNPGGGGYWINGIRLESGASSGTPGDTYFDEVRIATNWANLVRTDGSAPLLPDTGAIGGSNWFGVLINGSLLAPEARGGTTDVWYRIRDNLFGSGSGGGSGGNLQNPGFEATADPWLATAGNNIAAYAASAGTLAGGSGGGLLFNAWDNSSGAFGKYYQDVSATAGAQCVFSALMRQDEAFTTTFFGLKVQFLDANDNLLTISGANDGTTAMKSTAGVNTTTQRISVAATAPSGTDRVRCQLVLDGPPGPGAGGTASDLSNKGFDGNANSWTKQSDGSSIAFFDGNAGANAGGTGGGLKFDAYNNNQSGGYYQDAECQVGDVVTFSALMKQNGTWSTTFFGTRIQFLGAGDSVLATYSANPATDPVSTQARRISVSGTAPSGTVKVRCIVRMEGSPGGSDRFGYADDVQISGAHTASGGTSRFGYADNCQLSGAGQAASGSASMSLVFNMYDPESGLARGTSDPDTHCNLDVTNSWAAWKLDDVAAYSSARSSSDTTGIGATSTWYWASLDDTAFQRLQTDNYCNTNRGAAFAYDGRQIATNRVTMTVANASPNQGKLVNQQFGYLSIQDDDVDGPVPTLLYVGTNIVNDWGAFSEENRKITITDEEMLGGGVDIAYSLYDPSGIFVTNAAKTGSGSPISNVFEEVSANGTSYMANVCMNFDLTNQTYGSLGYDAIHSPQDLFGKNGDPIVTARVVNLVIPGVSKTNIPLEQPWTVTVSAQDMDSDRGSFSLTYTNKSDAFVSRDRTVSVNVPLDFHIVDDDVTGPTMGSAQTQFAPSNMVSDAQLRQGGWWLAVDAQDTRSGLSKGDGSALSPTNISPFMSIYSSSNYPLVVNDVFSNYTSIVSGTTGKNSPFTLSNRVAAADYYNLYLGAYTVTVSAADGDDDRYDTTGANIDRALSLNTNVGTFVVYDDDVDGPVLSNANVDGPGASSLSTVGELLFYDFGSSTAVTNTQPTRAVDSVSVSNLTANGSAPDTATGYSGGSGGAALTQNNWNNGTNFWEFSVTVANNFQLNITNLCFASRASATGPTSWSLRYSGDSFAGNLASGTLNNNGSYEKISSSVSSVMVSGAVSYRLYGTGASAGSGTWTLDDLAFTGRVMTAASAFLASDSDLNTNGVRVSVRVQDAGSGVRSITDTQGPYYVISSPSGLTGTNRTFGLGPLANGDAKGSAVTMSATGGFAYASIVLGTYTVRVAEVDYDDDRLNDSMTNQASYDLLVVDDDTTAPRISSQRGTYLTFNGASAGSESTAITDGSLTNGLSVTDRVYDTKSGILSASAQFRVLDPAGWDSGLQDFSTRPADGDGLASTYATGAIVAVTGFNVDLTNRSLGVWTTVVYAADFDNDRPGDATTNIQSFAMYVVDDDVLGPRMTNLSTMGAAATPILTSFETNDGWTIHSSAGDFTQAAYDGTWVGSNMIIQTFNPRGSVGYNASFSANQADGSCALALPAVDRPGSLILWAKLSGTPGTSTLAVERLVGGAWTSVGEQSISGTSYVEYAWTIDSTNLAESLRVRMNGKDSNNRSIYMDDLAVAAYKAWTNAGGLTMQWNAADDRFTGNSGIHEYRYTAFGSGAPQYATNGTSVSQGLSALPAASGEGVTTGYIFAVDGDADRGPVDRMMGLPAPFVMRVDTTAPAKVTGLTATNGFDDTAEISLAWTGACPNAGNRMSDNTPLSPWHSYVVYYTDGPTGPTTNDPYIAYDANDGPSTMATNTTTSLMLSNFVSGADYRLAIAGVDRAGNIGQLSDTVLVSVANFVVTQGVVAVSASNRVEISWIAKTNEAGDITRVFDALYFDSRGGFANATSNSWALLGEVTNSWVHDTGSVARVSPYSMTSTMRFYRAAIKDAWHLTNHIRRASQQIYVSKSVPLVPGENWLSLFAIPDEDTVAGIFGTNRLPASSSIANAARITWYGGATPSGNPVKTIYLSASNRWIYSLGGSGIADNMQVPLGEGFNVELPSTAPARNLIMIGQLPTNPVTQTIAARTNFNIVSCPLPRRMKISELGLMEAGFQAGTNPLAVVQSADELRILNNASGNGSMTSPRLSVWVQKIGSGAANYCKVGGFTSAGNEYVEVDETIIWLRRGSQNTTWTNDPARFYSVPGKNMNP